MKYPTKLLDEMWRTVCKTRDDHKCRICGQSEYVNVHHIIGRQNFGTRWVIENGICLCPKHHKFSRTDSAHINPIQFISLYVSDETKFILQARQCDEKDPKFHYGILYDWLVHYYTLPCTRLLAKCNRFCDRAVAIDKRCTERIANRAARKLARSTGDSGNGA